MDALIKAAEQVAPIDRFPTVDQIRARAGALADAHPDIARFDQVGVSTKGEPIERLTIGDGPIHVLVIGMPHPNEPIGMATIDHLATRLCADDAVREGVTWHFLPCVDPDGTRLNEGWFAGPFTREHYARHFYRPGAEAQVEWTFPYEGGGLSLNSPMPETRAVMKAIDEAKPDLVVSLHNGEFGGVFYYVTDDAPEFADELRSVAERVGVPLYLGAPDAPGSRPVGDAVFVLPSAAEIAAVLTAEGIDPGLLLYGGSSMDYTRRDGGDGDSLIVELPYWSDARACDQSDSGRTHGEVAAESAVGHAATVAALSESFTRLRPRFDVDPVLRDACQAFLHVLGTMAVAPREADPRPATVAEAFTSADWVHGLRLRLTGMYLRLLAAVPAPGRGEGDDIDVRTELDRVEKLFQGWCADAEAAAPSVPVPIHKLVAVQAGATAAAVVRRLKAAGHA
ncbi:Zinc carboxypeptidase [Sinosporangium album]|uniref:Zinc carboxypeptidase n=1 Tax=Sinosporangium album TaxID=504805 RepID=A0A1G8HJC9_9ACTN|nr:M14 family zinc carboxypeptidase [Sinosporangium album]SDI06776.1 Zinc carboxypeptidase [Sinosporangium album]